MSRKKLSRRQFVAATALSSAALITAPYVRGAYAAGKLSIGFWDHWVPGANKASTDLVNEWAAKEKVEVSIDYIPSQGNKILLTIAAEAQAKSGHDILAMPTWWPHAHAEQLEPVNDIMEPLIKQNGEVNGTVQISRQGRRQMARRSRLRRQPDQGALLAYRPDEEACRHRRPGNVSGRRGAEGRQLDHGHVPESRRGLPQGRRSLRHRPRRDQRQRRYRRARSSSRSAPKLVDAKGNVVVKTDDVRQALEYYKKLMAFLPPDAPAWDDASNNKWLVSGKGAMIMNPPSAWAVAKRDAPQVAEQCWTHGFPVGSERPVRAVPSLLLEHLEFLQEQGGGQEPAGRICRNRHAIEKMVAASGGYDLPAFEKLTTLKTWAEEGPPKGTLYHYPNPHNHQMLSISASPAPPKIAQQIYTQATLTKMCVRFYQGEAMEKTLAWAEGESKASCGADGYSPPRPAIAGRGGAIRLHAHEIERPARCRLLDRMQLEINLARKKHHG